MKRRPARFRHGSSDTAGAGGAIRYANFTLVAIAHRIIDNRGVRSIPFRFHRAARWSAGRINNCWRRKRGALLANVSITVSWRGVSRQRTRRIRPYGVC